MQIETRSLAQQQSLRGPGRPQAGADKPSLLDAYLPSDKAQKFKSYDALADDTHKWQASLRTRGIFEADLNRMTKAGDDYLPILKKALDNQAFADPKAFLKSLSTEELQTLQFTHGAADPINPDSLSQEGALNLLLPPGDARMDIDGDGIVEVGTARTGVFPPGNAPASVEAAWNEAMANVDPQTKAMAEITLHLVPPQGGSVGAASHEGTGIGPFRDLVKRAVDSLTYSQRFQTEQKRQYTERLTALLGNFDKALAAREST